MPRNAPNLAFVLYRENIDSLGVTLSAFFQSLYENVKLEFVVSPCHDSDKRIFMSGEFEMDKPHFHVLVDAEDSKSNRDAINTYLTRTYGDKWLIKHFEGINKPDMYFLYLRHEDPQSIDDGKFDYHKRDYTFYTRCYQIPKAHNQLTAVYHYARYQVVNKWLEHCELEHTRSDLVDALTRVCPQAVQWLCLTTFKDLWREYELKADLIRETLTRPHTYSRFEDKASDSQIAFKRGLEADNENSCSNNDTSNLASCSGPCADIVDVPLTKGGIQTTLKGLKKTSPKTDGDDYKKEIIRR